MEASFKQVEHKIIIGSTYIKKSFYDKIIMMSFDTLFIDDDFVKNFDVTIIFRIKRS